MSEPLAVAWGGGENSTAMVIGFMDRGIRPDIITFADTGGEKPHTMEFFRLFRDYLVGHGYPEIMRVKNAGMYESLEDNCLKKKMLPSLAYGFKSCSMKYKARPQDAFLKCWAPAVETWVAGGKVTKAIGYDADEQHRAKIESDDHYSYIYPLIDWEWGRDECQERILAAGLPLPGKSACFFCPASRKSEILDLKANYPDLLARAIAMEDNAKLDTVKGLGRRFSWREFAEADEAQGKLFPDAIEAPCMCFDGGDDA